MHYGKVVLRSGSTVGVQGSRTPPSSVQHPLEKSSTTLKILLDQTFSTFQITISGTFTVSVCRFLETI
jgi:hypothetical protein